MLLFSHFPFFSFFLPRLVATWDISFIITVSANCVIYRKVKNSLYDLRRSRWLPRIKHCFRGKVVGRPWRGTSVGHALHAFSFSFLYLEWMQWMHSMVEWVQSSQVLARGKNFVPGQAKNFSNNFRGKHFYYECDGERKFSLALCRSLKTLERSSWEGGGGGA